jgi:glutamate--cysteine ligase
VPPLPEIHEAPPIESIDQLVAYFHEAGKPRAAWRIGSEHEMIGVYRRGVALARAPGYDGDRGIEALLARVAAAGWAPVREGARVIAMARAGAQITIEPGGQLELSSRPEAANAAIEAQVDEYVRDLEGPSVALDLAWLAIGFRPFGGLADVPWMPKGRYDVMRAYLPTKGPLAHEMMKRTATVQVNLDYAHADDAAVKLRCAMSVTSILTALYASSPIVDGRVSGYQSYRGKVWRAVDPDRCGLLSFAFVDDDVFRAYTEWALDVPMFFVYRGGYRPASGMTFRQFLRDGFAGTRATGEDWALHLSTLFPETRLKQYMEIRSCDSGSREVVLSLGPLCRGLLYDETACAAATALTAGLSFAERLDLVEAVARQGFAARLPRSTRTVGDLARDLVAIADDGLTRVGADERSYLEPLREIAATGRTQADRIVDLWQAVAGEPAAVIAALAHVGLGRAP